MQVVIYPTTEDVDALRLHLKSTKDAISELQSEYREQAGGVTSLLALPELTDIIGTITWGVGAIRESIFDSKKQEVMSRIDRSMHEWLGNYADTSKLAPLVRLTPTPPYVEKSREYKAKEDKLIASNSTVQSILQLLSANHGRGVVLDANEADIYNKITNKQEDKENE